MSKNNRATTQKSQKGSNGFNSAQKKKNEQPNVGFCRPQKRSHWNGGFQQKGMRSRNSEHGRMMRN